MWIHKHDQKVFLKKLRLKGRTSEILGKMREESRRLLGKYTPAEAILLPLKMPFNLVHDSSSTSTENAKNSVIFFKIAFNQKRSEVSLFNVCTSIHIAQYCNLLRACHRLYCIYGARSSKFNDRGSQRDVVHLGWPLAPSYMSPNAGGGVELRGLRQWEHGVQINLEDQTPSLTYVWWSPCTHCTHLMISRPGILCLSL